MTDPQQREDDLEDITPKVPAVPAETEQAPAPAEESAKVPVKAQVSAVDRIMPIACKNIEEAYRTAELITLAGMVPSSFVVKDGAGTNWQATRAKMSVAIMAGSEVGFGPMTSLKTIYVINGKTSIFGEGAKGLVQNSGKLEWEKVEKTGTWAGGDFCVTVSLKRKGQAEPYVRSFGKEDAKRSGLLGRAKAGSPWQTYPERQTYWRAWTWCARDGFSDALMGLSIAEEVNDYAQIEQQRQPVDTSSLDDAKPTA